MTPPAERVDPAPARPAKKPVAAPPVEPVAKAAAPKVVRATEVEPPFGLNAIWVPDEVPVSAAPSVAADPDNPFAVSDDGPFGSAANVSAPGLKMSAASSGSPAEGRVRSNRRRNGLIGAAAAVVVVGGGLAAVALSRGPAADPAAPMGAGGVTAVDPAVVAPAVYSREMLKGNLALLEEFRPTHGQPIGMLYVPNGVNLVVHLRPAELWSSDRGAAELRASLTEGVTSWLDAKIKELCRREPSRVSEATFALVLGAFGTQPTSSQVVRLAEPDKMSVLLDEFRGQPLKENLKPAVTVSAPHAYVIVDSSTFSISPSETADELEESLTVPNSYVSRNVAELLKQTDRDRLITVVAEMQDLRRHVDTLFPESARPTMHAVIDWLGDDVDAIAWSLHMRPALYSELVLRPRSGVSPRVLEAAFQKKLDELPETIMAIVKGTRPAAKGFREIIGRYPAMLEAVCQSTILRPGTKDVHAVTVLPAKAATNLALGTLLTWDELRRSPGSAPGAAVASAGQSTEKVADRLKKEILAEFSMPLEQAVKYIGEETGVDFTVDGEALRMTGYTRNMPQKVSLGKVPATRALKEILSVPNQKDLAVFVDEAAGKAVMSTRPYLMQQGKAEFKVD
ncbi:hypothetical protein [Caulifigura coniformis]|uniref:hypothetical protein n=1 Tax=Caulifigura coniformis TaxID=2527983 RepID=UPI0018D253CB|nr:hypothetical protein [Caulifigura coniformis]